MMQYWIVVMLFVGIGKAEDSEKDHNGDAHQALCDVLKEAVGKWGDGGKHLSEPLQKALGKTIFGKKSVGETVESLRGKLPDDYEKVKDLLSQRYFWCGESKQEGESSGINPPRRSGHSAPHDMICLCTPGDGGWPLSGTEGSKKILCGRGSEEFDVKRDKEGWGISRQGKNQIIATWNVVVTECLKPNGEGTKLKDALEAFIKKLSTLVTGIHPYQSLGKGNFISNYSCSGTETQGVCVKYYPEEKLAIPWWKDLRQAIEADELEKKEKEESEKRKKEAQKQRQPQKQDQSQLPHEPRTAALRSIQQGSHEAEQANPENISTPLATLEDTSGTLIISPCPWLLSAALLI
ncbi:Variant surface glycoprotein [Trypanosoma congolense IL3000]|uniref:Variant surface glycoprotein n=1 Tax=Trypanosoma congolense (strain IL3000) TaxID=1068625 RepID=F9W9B0_TRYCI|nr:Variant surface glycoprotein [Trypanosoma congolense IL3000]